jgi:cytochrome P450
VPERFDSQSPWFKKPNGDSRHSLTFNPFLGGKRGCIGKTFAEVVVRYTVPILYYHFDFEMSDADQKKNKPMNGIAGRVLGKIPVKLTYK